MWTPFSLATLVLAASADEEPSAEESWIQRFEETDRLREKYEIPPLSPPERMRMMIGRPPFEHFYGLYLKLRTCRSYEAILMVWRKTPWTVETGEWIGIKEVEGGDPVLKEIHDDEEAKAWIRSLADRMFLPFVMYGG